MTYVGGATCVVEVCGIRGMVGTWSTITVWVGCGGGVSAVVGGMTDAVTVGAVGPDLTAGTAFSPPPRCRLNTSPASATTATTPAAATSSLGRRYHRRPGSASAS
ncbi:MAG: hypothetical protein JWR48_7301 [Mycobacterium sp.]|nr:hypothetical protein [Mycobacterium sp.]